MLRDAAWNKGRTILINSGSNLTGQLVTNGGDWKGVDYADVLASGLTKGKVSILFQSAVNVDFYDGLNISSSDKFVKNIVGKTPRSR